MAKKTREDLVKASFLNKTEIGELLQVPYKIQTTIFKRADEIDINYYKDNQKIRVNPKKVRLSTVLDVTGIELDELKKQLVKD